MKKLIKKSFHRKEKGFTLIELLIVIVIIGILAGVLIAVINPVRQQNRARNAAVRAAILKASFAVNTVRAGIGTLPSNSTLGLELENMVRASDTLCVPGTADQLNCQFTLSGTQLPVLCTPATNLARPGEGNSTGGTQCFMHLVSNGTDLLSGMFRIAAAKFPLSNRGTFEPAAYYLFDSSNGLMTCPATVDYTADFTTVPAGCVVVTE